MKEKKRHCMCFQILLWHKFGEKKTVLIFGVCFGAQGKKNNNLKKKKNICFLFFWRTQNTKIKVCLTNTSVFETIFFFCV